MARRQHLLVFWAALLALLAGPAPAEPLEEALALPVASELTGARDAPVFAWVEKEAGVRNIWLGAPGRPPTRLTDHDQDDGRELSDLDLSRDGARLAYVRGGDSEFPDDSLPQVDPGEAPRQEIFLVGTAGGAPGLMAEGHMPVHSPTSGAIAFTRRGEIWLWDLAGGARRLASGQSEVRRLQWSPDGAHLLFVSHRGDYSFVGLLDVEAERVRYLDPGFGFAVEPTFSPDGRQVAFIRFLEAPAGAGANSGPYWSIHVADVASGAARKVWAAPPGPGGHYEGTRSRNLFWSTGGKLVFPWERSGWLHAYSIDAARGGEPVELTPGSFEVETFLLDPNGRDLIYAANADALDRRHLWRRKLDGGVAARLTGGQGSQSHPAFGGGRLAAIATDAVHPAHPVLAERSLAPLGRRAAAAGFAAPESVRFRAADGVEVHAQLFRGRGAGPRPALLYVHGGPRRQMLPGFHPSGYYSNAYILNQHFAALGYHVLAVNYRSGTGYGAAFRDAPGTAREGAAEYRDILAAGRWLAARGDVDPARIGIWGGSWGGYLTALALARDSDLFAAGVDFHGVHSMLRGLPGNLSPAAQVAARQLQWDSSPLGSIDTWRSPVLLIHGDDDRNVDFSQSVLLARELAARRIPFRELAFPGERHSFLLHAHWLASFRATVAFFEAQLKAAPRR